MNKDKLTSSDIKRLLQIESLNTGIFKLQIENMKLLNLKPDFYQALLENADIGVAALEIALEVVKKREQEGK